MGLLNALTVDDRPQKLVRGRGEGLRFAWTREALMAPVTVLVLAVAVLSLLGLVMVFSASSVESVEAGSSPYEEFISQAAYMVVSLVAFVAIIHTRGSFWTGNTAIWLAWLGTLALLVLVLFAGNESHGATRWLRLGPMSLQPSEFAKITLVMVTARLLSDWERDRISGARLVSMLALFVVLPLGLILAQKDLGTILIIGTTLVFLGVLSGVRPAVLVSIVTVAVALVIVAIVTSGYRSQRLSVWLNPGSDYYGDGWQLYHSLFAFGSGGFFGTGLGNSAQKYSYLPEAHNDFIFAIIGEELGFVGSAAVIALFVVIGWAGMKIGEAARERDLASSLLSQGLTCSLLVQAILNMSGVLQLLPLTGRPLPFVSAGGSSILSCMIMVGMVVAVALDNEERAAPVRRRSDALSVIDGGAALRRR